MSERRQDDTETITRQMTIQEIFAKFPSKAQKLAQELTKSGLNCVGCSAATWETVESGVLRHGMTELDLNKLLINLNDILKKEADTSTITLTKSAAEVFKRISEQEGKHGWGLRFDERPAGCSGFEYVLEFSEKPTADDAIFTSEGIEIHVFKSAVSRLVGSEIDYVDGLLGTTPLALAVLLGSIQNCFTKAAKYSLFDTTKEMAFIPLAPEHKLKGKAAIDGIGSRLGKSGGSLIHQGLLVIFCTLSSSTPYVAGILLAVLAMWIMAVRMLGKQFNEMTHGIEQVDENADSADEVAEAPAASKTVQSDLVQAATA